MRGVRARHPGFREAVVADLHMTAFNRGDRYHFRSKLDVAMQILRLALVSDAYLAQVLYRAKAALQRRHVPFLPRIAHRLMMSTAQLTIGDPVVVEPGIYIVHGQVVIDGITKIGSGAVIAPFVSIGLQANNLKGPTLRSFVSIGTGAKVLGDVTLGDYAQVGANSVVVRDVADGTVVVGAPARPINTAVDPALASV